MQVLYPSSTADLVQMLYRYSWTGARFVLIKRKGVSFKTNCGVASVGSRNECLVYQQS